jgi:hypothetical protein
MAFERRGVRAVAVVPQDRQAVVALHEAHRLVCVGSHEQQKPSPHTTTANEPHLVVPSRDYTPFRQMLQYTGLHGVSITKQQATLLLALWPPSHLLYCRKPTETAGQPEPTPQAKNGGDRGDICTTNYNELA